MSGHARAGAVIYAKDLSRLAAFYRDLMQATALHEQPDHVVLQSADLQLIIHAIPPHIASSITIESPPEPREEQAIKLFFTAPSLDWARATARAGGGAVTGEPWTGPGFQACNAIDPEGNILQIREALE